MALRDLYIALRGRLLALKGLVVAFRGQREATVPPHTAVDKGFADRKALEEV